MEEGKKLIGTVYCSSNFKYKENKFTANFPEVSECLRELWGDDIICGFGIRSAKTGSVVFFELEGWEDVSEQTKLYKFIPSDVSLAKNPVLSDISAEITFERSV